MGTRRRLLLWRRSDVGPIRLVFAFAGAGTFEKFLDRTAVRVSWETQLVISLLHTSFSAR